MAKKKLRRGWCVLGRPSPKQPVKVDFSGNGPDPHFPPSPSSPASHPAPLPPPPSRPLPAAVPFATSDEPPPLYPRSLGGSHWIRLPPRQIPTPELAAELLGAIRRPARTTHGAPRSAPRRRSRAPPPRPQVTSTPPAALVAPLVALSPEPSLQLPRS
jgi:hypothetical protein